MNTKHFLLVAIMIAGGVFTASAQKYGHLNFGNLVASLPETEAADSELEAYQKQLNADLEKKTKDWQAKAETFVKDVQGGNLAPLKQQEREQALEQERNTIMADQQSIGQKVQKKRQELLKPIVEKVESAIKEVAKENGYTMIFDTSTFNAILFAQDSDDVFDMVKAKL